MYWRYDSTSLETLKLLVYFASEWVGDWSGLEKFRLGTLRNYKFYWRTLYTAQFIRENSGVFV
ncbi:MAG: hypothetical protein ETSY2_44950 [Candidatus Entotheonella gemina]|uniref:Uncharacterized protein n=1 Tax=Candidatus Entotheonella gemina TaxID=1429439 RepID=W4LGX9_9BACT|nr:MAG: hypothetical protein ETSY2_44950 [Candidatus Entotheonella gemina]